MNEEPSKKMPWHSNHWIKPITTRQVPTIIPIWVSQCELYRDTRVSRAVDTAVAALGQNRVDSIPDQCTSLCADRIAEVEDQVVPDTDDKTERSPWLEATR
ncbi:hypothetical protein PENSUB_1800 [Penicillium subrubescens]|uniref:Uncharacterized protein n=2 Tax=Penicillium subrubescens TaxID=1316194 RepID=A0A1Q5UJB4_9EURO|nr:hypothetical protein PENSUB_1800 [Penicillium subrubescens]